MKQNSIEQVPFQYITDLEGHKTAVILDIALFKKLIEELEDANLGSLAETIFGQHADLNEKTYTLEEIEKDLLEKK